MHVLLLAAGIVEGRESWRWALPAAADEPREGGLLLSRAVDDRGVVEPALDTTLRV